MTLCIYKDRPFAKPLALTAAFTPHFVLPVHEVLDYFYLLRFN